MAEGLILPNCLTVPSIYDAGESQGLILKAAAPSPQEDCETCLVGERHRERAGEGDSPRLCASVG